MRPIRWLVVVLLLALTAKARHHAGKPDSQSSLDARAGGSDLSADKRQDKNGNTTHLVIRVGDQQIARLGPLPETEAAAPQTQAKMDAFVASLLKVPIGSKLLFGNADMRTSESCDEALEEPLPRWASKMGKYPLGKLAVFMPGWGNWGPSIGFIARLSRYVERVAIVYQDVTSAPNLRRLVRATTIDDIELPPELVGRVFTFGSSKHRIFLDAEQASDLVIECFGELHAKRAMLGNLDVLHSKALLIGHSQGSFATTFARKRLIDAGYGDAVGKLMTIGGGLGLSHLVTSGALPLYRFMQSAVAAAGSPVKSMSRNLEYTVNVTEGKIDMKPYEALCDLGVAGVVGKGRQPYTRIQFRLASMGIKFLDVASSLLSEVHKSKTADPGDFNTDGIVPKGSAMAGKKTYLVKQPHDHAYLIEHWQVVDEVAEQLVAT